MVKMHNQNLKAYIVKHESNNPKGITFKVWHDNGNTSIEYYLNGIKLTKKQFDKQINT